MELTIYVGTRAAMIAEVGAQPGTEGKYLGLLSDGVSNYSTEGFRTKAEALASAKGDAAELGARIAWVG